MNTKLKTILLAAALVNGMAGIAYAADTHTPPTPTDASVTVTVTNIKSTTGAVLAGLYNSNAEYKGGAAFLNVMAIADSETVSLSFEHVPAGEYAIRLFHDVNSNEKFDVNSFGMPKEPYAFSNNAKGTMGPAKWGKAKFVVSGTTTHTIKLN